MIVHKTVPYEEWQAGVWAGWEFEGFVYPRTITAEAGLPNGVKVKKLVAPQGSYKEVGNG